MKQFYKLALLSILIAPSYPALAQNSPIQKRDTQKQAGQHIVTEHVTLYRTEIDNNLEEMEKFDKYISKHIKHIPGVHGSVTVGFTNEEDGSLTHVNIVKSLGKLADQEALRLVKSYPKWAPDTIDGKPVSSEMTIPIIFK